MWNEKLRVLHKKLRQQKKNTQNIKKKLLRMKDIFRKNKNETLAHKQNNHKWKKITGKSIMQNREQANKQKFV